MGSLKGRTSQAREWQTLSGRFPSWDTSRKTHSFSTPCVKLFIGASETWIQLSFREPSRLYLNWSTVRQTPSCRRFGTNASSTALPTASENSRASSPFSTVLGLSGDSEGGVLAKPSACSRETPREIWPRHL